MYGVADPLGKAMLDYQEGKFQPPLLINNYYGPPEEMAVSTYFRKPEEFSDLEQYALSLCKGEILDIGAGAGVHSLYLQENGKKITALEMSNHSCEVMRRIGVRDVVERDIFLYHGFQYDTLLLLMNGLGIVSNLASLPSALSHFAGLLKPGGQIICDTSDISYLFDEGQPHPGGYYGEIDYQFEYCKETGPWFQWLYLDHDTCAEVVKDSGWHFQIVYEDNAGQYLMRLTKC